jgi:hypothetical protein
MKDLLGQTLFQQQRTIPKTNKQTNNKKKEFKISKEKILKQEGSCQIPNGVTCASPSKTKTRGCKEMVHKHGCLTLKPMPVYLPNGQKLAFLSPFRENPNAPSFVWTFTAS